VPTGETLGRPVRNRGRSPLAPSADRAYSATTGGLAVSVPNFNLACTPAALVVRLPGGRRVGLVLHSVDTIRQTPRGAGLDDNPRLMQGEIEAPPAVLAGTDPAIRAFVTTYLGGRRFTSAPIDATAGALVFRDQGWRLTFRP